MQLSPPDKKALWQQAVTRLEAQLDPGLFYQLLNRCYLDSLEQGKGLLIAPSPAIQTQIERKAQRILEQSLTQLTQKPVRLQVALAKNRLYQVQTEPVINTRHLNEVATVLTDERQLAELHATYGDIMGIVDNHPLFHQVCKPIPQGGWGIFPQLLTNACKDYGVLTVLEALQRVANKPGLKNRRAYFFSQLKTGSLGYRLAKPADILGLKETKTPH